jgi:hypothetical protein
VPVGAENGAVGVGAPGATNLTIKDVLADLERLVVNLEPAEFPGARAAAGAERFAKAERLCRTAKALLAARAAECEEHQRRGHRSAESWLASLSGEAQGRAQSALGTVQEADAQPLLGAALRSGELSMDQAALVVDAARTAPGSVGRLLDVARRQPMGALRQEAERVKAAARSEESERARLERLHHQRSLKIGTTPDGAVCLRGELVPIEGAVVKAALEHEAKHVFKAARREGQRESHEAYLADALVRLCRGDAMAPSRVPGSDPSTPADTDIHRTRRADGARPREADDAGAGRRDDRARCPDDRARPPGDSRDRQTELISGSGPTGPAEASSAGEAVDESSTRPPRGGLPEYLVVLEVSLEALKRGELESGERCEIRGVGPVPLATLEDLIGRSRVNLVVRRGADVCSVVHMGRTIPAAIRSALERRDPVCCVPGCASAYGLEIDHRIPWSQGGPTELWNLCRLCRTHHRMKTYDGFRLEGRPDGWRWVAPTGACADGEGGSHPDERSALTSRRGLCTESCPTTGG